MRNKMIFFVAIFDYNYPETYFIKLEIGNGKKVKGLYIKG